MKKMKALKGKMFFWLKNRQSTEQTSSMGIWIFAAAMIILIVVGILKVGSETGYTNITDMFVETTTGVKTPKGEWNTP